MKKILSKIFLKLGLLPYFHVLREKYFPSAYYLSSKIDDQKYLIFYRKFIDKDDLCFDIGAHRGHRVGIFLTLGARVVAFEPQSELTKYLTLKYKRNIIVRNIGLGAKRDKLYFFKSNISTLSTFSESWTKKAESRFQNASWVVKKPIEVYTIDEMILLYGVPKFCKIDVEGFEFEVLKGLNSSIPILSFEFMLPENLDILFNCLSRLFDINSEIVINYSIGDTMKLELDNWLNYTDARNLFQLELAQVSTWGDIYVKMP